MRLFYIVLCIFLFGCNDKPTVYYSSEKDAAVEFYKNNISDLQSLKSNQEILSWIVKCKDGYFSTDAQIVGIANVLNPPLYKNCDTTSTIHSHPVPQIGMTMDFFSKADVHASNKWNMYLLSQENCNVRLLKNDGTKNKNRNGIMLGKLSKC